MPIDSGQHQKLRHTERVVVTGAGIITSLGCGWQSNADGFRLGRQAFRKVALFDTTGLRVHQAGEIDLPDRLPDTHLSPRQVMRLDRASQLLLHAASEALTQANWDLSEEEQAIPLSLGTSAGAMACGEEFCRQALAHPDQRRGQATRIHHYQTQHQALTLQNAFRFQGPTSIISNACASGANAIGHAFHLLKHGGYRRAIAGGYDALSHLVYSGFDSLQALTPELPPRPFDAHRKGLALGEGAAVLTLETLDSARKRNANILAELSGYGASTDIHHLTQPHPEGDAALRSMSEACLDAGLDPGDIQYINAHGTGTPKNDSAEGRAIQRWAGSKVNEICASSTKASIGHLLGGAGAVEATVCLMALEGQWMPPTTTVETPDPICTFDLVREARDAELNHVLTNSFGFGGANASLILSRFP